ncbi:MAG: hypothetical protein ACK5QT_05030, partial [Oligoflexia bacterium]
MKLLFLHPKISGGHPLVQALKARGAVVLPASSSDEAMQILNLHGGAVDAAIVHREGDDGETPDGLSFISRVRQDPGLVDLPMVVTSSRWTDP